MWVENHLGLPDAGNDGLTGGGAMPNENAGGRRTQPVRITHLSIAPGDPRGLEDGPLVIMATLDPGPDREEQQWWTEQLRDRVEVRAWTGTFPGRLTSVQVEAPADQVEAVGRRLLTSIDEANAAYSGRYPAWRRENDKRIAEKHLLEQRRLADQQAILDRLMDEHRTN
jgi:hypothetical protein